VVSTTNLVIFFLAFEIVMLPILWLISIWGSLNNRQSINYLMFYTALGAVPTVIGLVYI
jgi:NADH-quinone oxidoreductase subunit M